jgi:hypothetical protein
MSFGVDTLGGLAEKLKQLVNDTQNLYESFIDANQLYKQGKMGDKEFFAKIGEFLVATSALNFLAVRVILEMKTAMEKGTSIKGPTGGSSYPSAPQAGFGIGGFVGTGGTVGPPAAGGGSEDTCLLHNKQSLPSSQSTSSCQGPAQAADLLQRTALFAALRYQRTPSSAASAAGRNN